MIIDKFHLSLFNLLENYIYIYKIDIFTKEKEILFINKKIKETLNISKENDIFKKNIPLDKFLKDYTSKEEDLNTDNEYIEYMKRKYLVTRSSSIYNNQDVVLCICNDVTEGKTFDEKPKILKANDLLIESIKALKKDDEISTNIYKIISMIGNFYSAEKTYIYENLSDYKEKGAVYQWVNSSKSKDYLTGENIINEIENWNKFIENETVLLIDNIDILKNKWEEKYIELKQKNTKNLVVSGMKFLGKPLGLIYLENVNEIKDFKEYTLLSSLLNFILNEIKRKKISQKLNFLSYHDFNTGLFNRVKYMHYLENSKFLNIKSIGIAIIDINGLNQINTNMGTDFGNNVILELSKTLKKFFRLIDIYRIGGDDFAIICENISKEDFYKKINSINKYFIELRENSISIGYIWKDKDINIKDLVHIAYDFMYTAKIEFYEAISNHNNNIYCSMVTEAEDKFSEYNLYLGYDNELDFTNKNISFKAKQEIFQYKVKKMIENPKYKNLVMFMFDIDNFKAINEMYGYNEGDKILIYINTIINKIIFGKGICCHSHSDIYYFCVDIPEEYIYKILEKINMDIYENNPNIRIILSYGIYKIENRETSVEEICERVNYAHKMSKKQPIEKVVFYDEKIREEMLAEKQIENDMENGIKNCEFELYLQPKYNSYTEKIAGAEALVRWNHHKNGLIFPDKFINIFEKNGFIVNLDLYMLNQVCLFIKESQLNNIPVVPIAVNMSKLNFKMPEFKNNILSVIKKYNIDPNFIEIEITEGLMIEDKEKIIQIINEFKKENLKISIDDFGTGYSSLSVLQKLPVDILKIDREFFNNFKKDKKGALIIKNIINLAKDLKLKVVAEGVETKEELEFLKELGCEIIQGYYFSKPITLNQFKTKLSNQNVN